MWLPEESATWSGLPRDGFYQVRITAGWFGGGTMLVQDQAVPHQLAQGNVNQLPSLNSTSSYCYLP